MKSRMILGCLLALAAATASAQAPIPVVERVFTEGEVATRVTLFSNRVVVVSITDNGVQGYFKYMTLPPDQYLIYLGILQRAVLELGERPVTSAVSTPRSQLVLNLHMGPDSPRRIEYLTHGHRIPPAGPDLRSDQRSRGPGSRVEPVVGRSQGVGPSPRRPGGAHDRRLSRG